MLRVGGHTLVGLPTQVTVKWKGWIIGMGGATVLNVLAIRRVQGPGRVKGRLLLLAQTRLGRPNMSQSKILNLQI